MDRRRFSYVRSSVWYARRGAVRLRRGVDAAGPRFGIPAKVDPPTPMSPRHRFTLTSSRNPVTTIFLAVSVM